MVYFNTYPKKSNPILPEEVKYALDKIKNRDGEVPQALIQLLEPKPLEESKSQGQKQNLVQGLVLIKDENSKHSTN